MVPTVKEAGWAPGPAWTSAENLAPTGIPSPDRPSRSQSLYRLSYPVHVGIVRVPVTNASHYSLLEVEKNRGYIGEWICSNLSVKYSVKT